MSGRLDEVKLDIAEFNDLLSRAQRQRTKDVLSLEIRKLQMELSKIMEEQINTPMRNATLSMNSTKKCYEVKLNNYCWDQTNNVVKLYITLKDVHQLPKEAVTCDFTETSMDLRVMNLDNKNYHLPIINLCEEIDTERSYVKVKTDMIVVSLAKKVPKSWSHVTGVEKRIKEAKTPSVPDIGEDGDPSASLMNLMKKMYQEGDDEMKKTIAKAWTQSQEKNAAGLSDYP